MPLKNSKKPPPAVTPPDTYRNGDVVLVICMHPNGSVTRRMERRRRLVR